MKKRFTEEQIIGFLREAEAGLPIAELCRKYAFSEASYYLWLSKMLFIPCCWRRRKSAFSILGVTA
jgi:hypothetical protein